MSGDYTLQLILDDEEPNEKDDSCVKAVEK